MLRHPSSRQKWAMLLISGGLLMQVIPFGCGQGILHLVTPWLLNGTSNILDTVVKTVAPLVLP